MVSQEERLSVPISQNRGVGDKHEQFLLPSGAQVNSQGQQFGEGESEPSGLVLSFLGAFRCGLRLSDAWLLCQMMLF